MEVGDEDVWTEHGDCTICRIKTEGTVEKEEHRVSAGHLKKYKVHSFFRDDITKFQSPNASSELLERYKLRKTAVVGLQQCIEVQQLSYVEQIKSKFWACSICYVAGDSLETADTHLRSMEHIRNYMIEEEEEEAERIDESAEKCDRFEMYQAAAIARFQKNGGTEGLQSPDVLRVDKKSAFIREKLGIFEEENKDQMTFQTCDKENKSILNCSTCYEVFPVNTSGKKHTNEKARNGHCEHPNHRRCSEIKGIIQEFEPEEKLIEFRTTERQSELHWIETETGWSMSQPCGLRYVISAGDESMCLLCNSSVASRKVEHCSGEYHAMKFMNIVNSNISYLAHQLRGSARRQKVVELLRQAMDLGNDSRIVCRSLSRLPESLKLQLAAEMLAFPEAPEVIIDDYHENGTIFVLCHSCSTYIELEANSVDTPAKMNAAWLKHVKTDEHFDAAAMKAKIHFSPELYVPYPPTTIMTSESNPQGIWQMVKDVLVQSICDVGLEFMVEDDNENEVVCQCCWMVFNKNIPGLVTQHVRSYAHLRQYMFHRAPERASFLLGPESDQRKRDFLLEWLQQHSGLFAKRMTVYSKFKSLELASWSPVSQRTVQTTLSVSDSDRAVYETMLGLVDAVSGDGAEMGHMSAREALLAAQMLIINTTRGLNKEIQSVVCRCLECDQLVVVNAATWQQDLFIGHVGTDEHHRRAAVLKENVMSAFGILEEKSTYTVKPLVQMDPSKKCTWQWNNSIKKHDYVGSIVGLEDIIERRHPSPDGETQIADFLCLLCAKTFPKRAASLESHVRDINHCINWVHKHRAGQIRDLKGHLEGDNAEQSKELRKYLNSILKDIHPTSDYCIKVYDPQGELIRRQNVILQRIQEEEKRKRIIELNEHRTAVIRKEKEERAERLKIEIAEQLKKQEVERKLKAEENEKRQEEEKRLAAERAARLEYAKKNAKKFLKESEDDRMLRSRLENASRMEKEKERHTINITQAKLEAERIRILSKFPGHQPPPAVPSGVRDPQLVIMPQLTTKNVPFAGQSHMPVGPPPVFYPPGIHNPHNPYAMPPQPAPVVTAHPSSFSMSFSTIPKMDPPAVQKRPSLRGQHVEPNVRNPAIVKNKSDLLGYMRADGAIDIVESEIPHDFIRQVQDEKDAFGLDSVAEVICWDEPTLDSYLCTICHEWQAPKHMIRHLCTTSHKSKFLYSKYPDYHKAVELEKNSHTKRNIFKNFIGDLKARNMNSKLKIRMKTIIDKQTIERLWPGYEDHFFGAIPSGQWSSSFQEVSGGAVELPNVVQGVVLIDSDEEGDDRSRKDRKTRERSRSRDRSRRSRSRSRDRRRRGRSSRSRSRSRDRHDRDRHDRHKRRDRRSRSRTRSRSRSPGDRNRSSAPRSRTNTWSAQTDSFLAKLGENKMANVAATSSKPRDSPRDDYASKLANVRDLAQSGVIQGAQISIDQPGIFSHSSGISASHIAAAQAAKDERRIAKEKEEQDQTMKRKMMGAMMMLHKMIDDYGGHSVPRDAILSMYENIGLNPEDGDREINKILDEMRVPKAPVNTSTANINASISSLGIQLKQPPQYQQPIQHYAPVHQYTAPAPAPAPAPIPQYGIPSSGPSAYAQAFHVASTSSSAGLPVPVQSAPPVVSAPTSTHNNQKSFYADSPTFPAAAVANKQTKDSSSEKEDDEYAAVYQALKVGKKKNKVRVPASASSPAPKTPAPTAPAKPLIPGQKMALKRTILPSGARVDEEKKAATSSSSPATTSIQSEPVTPIVQQPVRPVIETSFGMPAPVAISTAPTPQQQVPFYGNVGGQVYQQPQPQQQQPQIQQQTYQQYQQQQPPQYQQQMYQQPPPMAQPVQSVQYGIPPMYQQQQQPQPQQQMYQQQQQPMMQQQMYQLPPPAQAQPSHQWPPAQVVPQQQPQQAFYQQQAPPQNPAPQYGIGANPQYYPYQR